MVVKLVLMSDTHTHHSEVLEVPNGDILIHAGDFSYRGTIAETKSFLHWFSSFPHSYKIFISGNHDWLGERDKNMFNLLLSEYSNVIYLHEQSVNILGLNIFGSPYTPEFCNWAFNVKRGPDIAKHWKLIPEDTNVLITHGPPNKILDYVFYDKVNVGCEELSKRIEKLENLKLHVFGHIHCDGGKQVVKNNVAFVNASLVSEQYKVVNNPIVFEVTL